MKVIHFLSFLCLLVAIALMPITVNSATERRAQADVSVSWENPNTVAVHLSRQIADNLTGLEREQVQAFFSDTKNLQMLQQSFLAWSETDAQKESRKRRENATRELESKRAELARLKKALVARGKTERNRYEHKIALIRKDIAEREAEQSFPGGFANCRKTLAAICADNRWMSQILFSGELHGFSNVVQIIHAISKSNAKVLKPGVERDTVTAVALEFSRFGWKNEEAVKRAKHFLKYWRRGRLNSSFDNLPIHQRRAVCGWKSNHPAGTVEAMEWAVNNVHLPDDQYTNCCWSCEYLAFNHFGDSVQLGIFAEPYSDAYGNNHMTLTRNAGGVCGALSHFGAAAACANGVPALTSGEPEHCSYVVLVNGVWTPAYSLSWQRWLHWSPWNNNGRFCALHLTDSLFAKDAERTTHLSNIYRMLARVFIETSKPDQALICYQASAEAAPLNYPMWREYAAFLAKAMPKNAEAWTTLNSHLSRGMASVYPGMAAMLFRNHVYPNIEKLSLPPQELLKMLSVFWHDVKAMGPDRWYIEEHADVQLALLRKKSGNSESLLGDFYLEMLKGLYGQKDYCAVLLPWGNRWIKKLSPKAQKSITEGILNILANTAQNEDSDARNQLIASLILDAERSRDLESFVALSRLVPAGSVKSRAPIPAFDVFPGRLVSEGGMVFASSTSAWDEPHTHSGILTRQGGQIHTEKERDAWIAVKLPRHANISGIVFVGTHDWKLYSRFHPIRVQVSETGKDNDWHNAGEVIPKSQSRVNRFDLQKENPRALYIRILREGGPEYFHCEGIYVYGTPSA